MSRRVAYSVNAAWEVARESREGFYPSRILATPRVRDSEQKLRRNNPICASTDDVLSTTSAEKRCLQTGRFCDVVEIPQSRMATTTSRPPAQDIRDTVNPPRGFDQSAMLTSYRVWDK